MGNLLIAFLLVWASFKVNGEITLAKLNRGRPHAPFAVSPDRLFARDTEQTCPNPNGPNCGGGNYCCGSNETCCPNGCAIPGWVCCGAYGTMPQGGDCCTDSHFCEPGTYCVQCPRNSPFYPARYCCNKPQSSLAQYLPSGYSYSSLPGSFSVAAFSSSSAVGLLPSSSSAYPLSSPVAPSSFSVGGGGASSSSYAPRSVSSQGGLNYQYFTTTWTFYYVVYYTTEIQVSSFGIASSTTTLSTVISCYAADARAATSQFNTLEATISSAAESLQSSISASLFAAHGAASASASAPPGGSVGHTNRVDATTAGLLVLGAILPGILAVIL